MKDHHERKHSKFSASGSERWMNCQGSVALCEKVPSKDTVWSIEGTKAHEVLERVMLAMMRGSRKLNMPDTPPEMVRHGFNAANFILGIHNRTPNSEVMVETRISLSFVHPEAFGTFDGGVVDHFGTLHVFDYKYGAGHAVSALKNTQMIFYGMGLAHRFDWNFKRVKLWIIQPRIKGYVGPTYWDLGIRDLKRYVPIFKRAVDDVEKKPNSFKEGSWCHWCNAKGICPLKQETKFKKVIGAFQSLV